MAKALLLRVAFLIGLTAIVTDAEAARWVVKSTGMQRSSQQTNQLPANSTTNAPQRNPQQANNTTQYCAKISTAKMDGAFGRGRQRGIATLSHFGIGEGLAVFDRALAGGNAFMVFKISAFNAFRAKKPQPAGTYGYSRDDRNGVGQTNSPSPFTPVIEYHRHRNAQSR